MTQNNEKITQTRVSVKIGDFQVELEGSQENVEKLMAKQLFDFVKTLKETSGEVQASSNLSPEISMDEEEVSVPPLGRPSNATEAVSQLFKTDWGKKPRTLPEVMKALEINGLYYKKAVIATILVDLIKKKQLRRLGEKRNFQYVQV